MFIRSKKKSKVWGNIPENEFEIILNGFTVPHSGYHRTRLTNDKAQIITRNEWTSVVLPRITYDVGGMYYRSNHQGLIGTRVSGDYLCCYAVQWQQEPGFAWAVRLMKDDEELPQGAADVIRLEKGEGLRLQVIQHSGADQVIPPQKAYLTIVRIY